jgi:hypothetical protein
MSHSTQAVDFIEQQVIDTAAALFEDGARYRPGNSYGWFLTFWQVLRQANNSWAWVPRRLRMSSRSAAQERFRLICLGVGVLGQQRAAGLLRNLAVIRCKLLIPLAPETAMHEPCQGQKRPLLHRSTETPPQPLAAGARVPSSGR